MPCDSSYMEASDFECKIGRVYSLLEEIQGLTVNHARSDYHPLVYNKCLAPGVADASVAKLCDWCKGNEDNLSSMSLELQMWWRDHLNADEQRLEREAIQKADARTRQRALSKLTLAERKLLGVA